MAFDCTQALDEDFEDLTCTISEKIVVGSLVIGDTRHDICSGVNIIGRDSATCDIVIDKNVLSKQHAAIEVKNKESHLIYDMGSLNKTRMEKLVLEPQVRYNLETGTNLIFGNIHGQYLKTDHVEDSSRETAVRGEKSLETLKTFAKKEELNNLAVDSNGFDIRATSYESTVADDETDCEETGDGDNIFDMETQCQDVGNTDADDPIFYMQTQEFEEDTYKPPCELLTVNENTKDRSLLEDDSDIFDNLVLEQSQDEIACTVEGKVEEKHLRHMVVEESDNSGDETDPENVFMAATVSESTGDSKENVSLKWKLKEKEGNGNLAECKSIRRHENFSDLQAQTAHTSLVEKSVKQETSFNNKSLLTDDADCSSDTDSEGVFSSHIQVVKYDISRRATHELDNKSICTSMNESKEDQSSSKVTGGEKQGKMFDFCAEPEQFCSESTKANMNRTVNIQPNNVESFSDGVHEACIPETDYNSRASQPRECDKSTKCNNSDTKLVASQNLYAHSAINEVVPGSDTGQQSACSKTLRGKVQESDVPDVNTITCQDSHFAVDNMELGVSDRSLSSQNINDKEDMSSKYATGDEMNAQAQNIDVDVNVNEGIHQDTSDDCNSTDSVMDAPTQIINDEAIVGRVVHQNVFTVSNESDNTDDVSIASTQIVSDEFTHSKVILQDTSTKLDKYSSNKLMVNMSTGIAKGETSVHEVVQHNTSMGCDVTDEVMGASTQIFKAEVSVGRVVDQNTSMDAPTQRTINEVTADKEIQQKASTVLDENVIIDDVPDAPTKVVNGKIVAGEILHQNTSPRMHKYDSSEDTMDMPTQVEDGVVTVNGASHKDICVTDNTIDASTKIVKNEVAIGRVVDDDTSVATPTQRMNYEVIDGVTDAPTQVLNDEDVVGRIIHQNTSNRLHKYDSSGDIMNMPTQVVDDEVIVDGMSHNDNSVVSNIMDAPTQIMNAEDMRGKIAHQNASFAPGEGKTTPTIVLNDEATVSSVSHQDISAKLNNAPIQIVNDKIIVGGVVHQTAFTVPDDIGDVQNPAAQAVSDELTVGKVIHQNTVAKFEKHSDEDEDIMDMPTQVVSLGVGIGDHQNNSVKYDVTVIKRDNQNIFAGGDITDDVPPTQVMKDNITVGRVIHTDISVKCEIIDNVMDGSTQIMNDEVSVTEVSHKNKSSESGKSLNTQMQTKNKNLNIGEITHQVTNTVHDGCGVVNASSHVLDEVIIGKVIHPDTAPVLNDCDGDNVITVATRGTDEEQAIQNVDDNVSRNAGISSDVSMPVACEDRSVGSIIHQNTRIGHSGCGSDDDITDVATQVIHDREKAVQKVDGNVSSDASNIGDVSMHIVCKDRSVGSIIHQNTTLEHAERGSDDDIVDAATQVINEDKAVQKVDGNVSSDVSNISDVSMPVACEDRSVGSIIHQNTRIGHSGCGSDDDITDVATQVIHDREKTVQKVYDNVTGDVGYSSNVSMPIVCDDRSVGTIIHQNTSLGYAECGSDDNIMDATTQVINGDEAIRKVDDNVPSDVRNISAVPMCITCEDRSVGSIIHQNIKLEHAECGSDDTIEDSTQVINEDKPVTKVVSSSSDSGNNLVTALAQDRNVLKVDDNVSSNVGNDIIDVSMRIVCEDKSVGNTIHQSTRHVHDEAVEPISKSSDNHKTIVSQVEVSPVLSYTKHLRCHQTKQHELLDNINAKEIVSHTKTKSMEGIEVLTAKGNNIQHARNSSQKPLRTHCSKQREIKEEDTAPTIPWQKAPRTYSSKRNAGKHENVIKSKSSAKNYGVSFSSSSKTEPHCIDIAESFVSGQSNKRSHSVEENETRYSKKMCGGIEAKCCSVQRIWPGKHQTYPGKRQSPVRRNSSEEDTCNNIDELPISKSKCKNASDGHETGKTRSLRKRKRNSNRDSSPKDSNYQSPDNVQQYQSQDSPIQAENLSTRPKRNRKMTWKMIELEKASPTTVKSQTQKSAEKSKSRTLSNNVNDNHSVVRYTGDTQDDKNSLPEGNSGQNILKVCAPFGQQREERTVRTRKLRAENLTSPESVTEETPNIKKNVLMNSSKRNSASIEGVDFKVQAKENTPVRSNYSSVRNSSLTSEEIDEKIQEKGKKFMRLSRKIEPGATQETDTCRQNRVKEKISASPKEETDNEKMQETKIKRSSLRKYFTPDEKISAETGDVTNGFQKSLKKYTRVSIERMNENEMQERKNQIMAQNNLRMKSSTGEVNTVDRKNSSRGTPKSSTSKCFVPKEEDTNKILQGNKVTTRNSLNKKPISSADKCSDIPEAQDSTNVQKQTRKRSAPVAKNVDHHKETAENNVNSGNKKQKISADEIRNKRSLQMEESMNENDTNEDNLNVSNSQRSRNVAGTSSRKQTKKSSLPKNVSNRGEEERTRVDGSQPSSTKSAPVTTRTDLKRLTNIGRGKISPKKSVAPVIKTQVMFTGLTGEQLKAQEAIVERLGGSVVDQPGAEMVLVAQKLCRTIKMLCAIARGIPIVNCSWLVNCNKKDQFVDTNAYILHDKEGEKKFKMSLSKTLLAATLHPLLTDYTVMVTPHVVPAPKDMKVLVESCGGAFVSRSPRHWPSKAFVVSCEEDKSQWQKLRKAGVAVVGPEVILTGVLQHEIDLTSHQLVKC